MGAHTYTRCKSSGFPGQFIIGSLKGGCFKTTLAFCRKLTKDEFKYLKLRYNVQWYKFTQGFCYGSFDVRMGGKRMGGTCDFHKGCPQNRMKSEYLARLKEGKKPDKNKQYPVIDWDEFEESPEPKDSWSCKWLNSTYCNPICNNLGVDHLKGCRGGEEDKLYNSILHAEIIAGTAITVSLIAAIVAILLYQYKKWIVDKKNGESGKKKKKKKTKIRRDKHKNGGVNRISDEALDKIRDEQAKLKKKRKKKKRSDNRKKYLEALYGNKKESEKITIQMSDSSFFDSSSDLFDSSESEKEEDDSSNTSTSSCSELTEGDTTE